MTSRGACLEMSRLLPEGRERWLPSAECLYNVNISYWHQYMIYTNAWVANIHVSKVRIVSMWIVIATSWSHSTSIRVPVQKLRQVEVKSRKYIIDSYTHLWLLWVAVHGPGGADLLSEVATQVDEVQKGQLPCLCSIYASLCFCVYRLEYLTPLFTFSFWTQASQSCMSTGWTQKQSFTVMNSIPKWMLHVNEANWFSLWLTIGLSATVMYCSSSCW